MIEIHTWIGQWRFQSIRRPRAVSKIAHILKFLNLECGVAVTRVREREKLSHFSSAANDHNAKGGSHSHCNWVKGATSKRQAKISFDSSQLLVRVVQLAGKRDHQGAALRLLLWVEAGVFFPAAADMCAAAAVSILYARTYRESTHMLLSLPGCGHKGQHWLGGRINEMHLYLLLFSAVAECSSPLAGVGERATCFSPSQINGFLHWLLAFVKQRLQRAQVRRGRLFTLCSLEWKKCNMM